MFRFNSLDKKRLVFNHQSLTLMVAECKLNNLTHRTALLTKKKFATDQCKQELHSKSGRRNATVFTHKGNCGSRTVVTTTNTNVYTLV